MFRQITMNERNLSGPTAGHGSLSEGAGAKRLIVARAHRCAVGPHSGREGPTLGRACYPSRGIGSQRWISSSYH
jgi:hypothetical protein